MKMNPILVIQGNELSVAPSGFIFSNWLKHNYQKGVLRNRVLCALKCSSFAADLGHFKHTEEGGSQDKSTAVCVCVFSPAQSVSVTQGWGRLLITLGAVVPMAGSAAPLSGVLHWVIVKAAPFDPPSRLLETRALPFRILNKTTGSVYVQRLKAGSL